MQNYGKLVQIVRFGPEKAQFIGNFGTPSYIRSLGVIETTLGGRPYIPQGVPTEKKNCPFSIKIQKLQERR